MMWWPSQKVDLSEKRAIANFEQFILKSTVFNFPWWGLTISSIGMAIVGMTCLQEINSGFLVITYLWVLGIMWWLSQKVDLSEKRAIANLFGNYFSGEYKVLLKNHLLN